MKESNLMKNILKYLGCVVLCCLSAACSGNTHSVARSGIISLEVPRGYIDDSEAYLKESAADNKNGVKSLMRIRSKESPTYCRFREITYLPQDKEFKANSQQISAGFAEAFSNALIKNPTSLAPGSKALATQIMGSIKANISDQDAWLSSLRFTMQQSTLIQYYLDSHTLAIEVPGSNASSKKFIVAECRLVGYPAQMQSEMNDLFHMFASIKLYGSEGNTARQP